MALLHLLYAKKMQEGAQFTNRWSVAAQAKVYLNTYEGAKSAVRALRRRGTANYVRFGPPP